MMGGSHALTGGAAWVAVTSTAPYAFGWHPVSPTGVLIGSIVAAGAALAPDADHHNATIAHSLPSLGPIPSPTKLLATSIGRIAGGHRHGTHSIVGTLIFGLVAALANLIVIPNDTFGTINVGGGLLALLLIAFAAKALKLARGGWISTWGLAIAGAVAVTLLAPDEWGWLPLAMVVGVVTHILGDMLTVGGCPLLFPLYPKQPKWLKGLIANRIKRGAGLGGFFTWLARSAPSVIVRLTLGRMWQPNGFFAVPLLGKTGSIRELLFASIPVTLYYMWGVMWATAALVGADPTPALQAINLLP